MKKRIVLFIVIVLTIFTVSISVVSLAKYYSERKMSSEIISDKFYFTVDLLGNTNDSEDLTKTYHLYGGDEKDISFNIQNYFDDLRITENDFSYKVTVEDELSLATSTILTGSLEGNTKNSTSCSINIKKGYTDNYLVKVIVESTSSYEKTMTINFILHTFDSNMEVVIKDSSSSMMAELVISSNVDIVEKSLIIDYSDINKTANNLQVDMTNSYLLDGTSIITNKIPDGKTFLQTVTVTRSISSGESVSILFFKDNISVNYALSEITITNTIVDGDMIYRITIIESAGE